MVGEENEDELTLVKLFRMKNRCGKCRASILELVDVEPCSLSGVAEPEASNVDASLSLSVSHFDLEWSPDSASTHSRLRSLIQCSCIPTPRWPPTPARRLSSPWRFRHSSAWLKKETRSIEL
jgi:hypothetical protein